jgi:uncharacterized protein
VSDAVPLRATATGIVLQVRLTPKSSRDAVDGVENRGEATVLKARVRAVPEDGKANAALESVLATWLGVARRSVEVTAGGKSRLKTVTVTGDAGALAAAVTAKLAGMKG